MSDPTRAWIADLLAQFSGQENTLTIPRVYVTITGSIEAGLLLNQIVYWSDRTKMNDGWFAKSYAEWEDEITLSKRVVSRAIPILETLGVETKVKRFNGSPTLHYRINREVFAQSIVTLSDNGKLQNVTIQRDKMSQSSTESTTKTTTKEKSAGAPVTVQFPKSIRAYTIEHIEAYQAQHPQDVAALIDAWAGGMFALLIEFTNKVAHQYIETHMELERLHIPLTEYAAIATHTKKCEGWKIEKGGSLKVIDMLDHLTDYQSTPTQSEPNFTGRTPEQEKAKRAHDWEEMFGAKRKR